jgi:hypothetical protein
MGIAAKEKAGASKGFHLHLPLGEGNDFGEISPLIT